MKRVLFVDDEVHVLDALRRMLRYMRREWDTEFVLSGGDALERLAARPFDVVVSDMRMPRMDGARLLEEVRRKFPATVRIVLSGHCDHEAVLRMVKVAHQFLAKPCDSEAIATAVMRACRLAGRLSDPWHRELVSRVACVPSSASARAQLASELEAAEPSMERVGEIVAGDVGATAKLLQLVSSNFFGSPRASSDPVRWAGWLGIDTIQRLVLREEAVHTLAAGSPANSCLEALSAHSRHVARCAKALMESEASAAMLTDQAYLAGLLHDIGLFILAEHLPQRVAAVWTSSAQMRASAWESECATFGAAHADIGGCLLAVWGAPDAIVDATLLHHTPALSSEATFGVLTAVHVANAVADAADLGLPVAPPLVDMAYLERIGCAGRLAQWCELCRAVNSEEVLA
jgi:HD-like signal output (HDOD) protein